jgi:purine-binding chemotaxis protein CheW
MADQQNKFLTFKLGKESYALPILKVKEIIGMVKITKVPKLPSYIKGVINIRGQIIPVIDLRLKFGLMEREYNDRTSIILVERETENSITTSGIIVDTVKEVLDIDAKDIESSLDCDIQVDQAFLQGIGKTDDDVIMFLNTDQVCR